MLSIDNSTWFYEFEFNGERKRIHRFAHLPLDIAMMARDGDASTLQLFDELLKRDCGMSVTDLDGASAKALMDELSKEGETLGE